MTNRPTRSLLVTAALGLLAGAVLSATHFVSTASAGLYEGQERKIAAQLLKRNSSPSDAEETVSVIIQLRRGNRNGLVGFLNANGIRLNKEFKNLDSATIELPVRLLPELATFNE